MTSGAESRFYRSKDGLRLHFLEFHPARDDGRPAAICLPGLTRGAHDFAILARALADDTKAPRRVVAFDYRGRGRSDHDPDWRHYDLATERADILAGVAVCGIERAHFVGTSRGGLHVMALAPTHRAMIRSAVFNDIGPVLEPAGLERIKGYVGRMSTPRSYDEAIKLLKIGSGAHFDGLAPAEWRIFAETTFGPDEGDLHLRYDARLARTLEGFDLTKPLPESWDLFDALCGTPVLTIRGANSDLLSEATFDAMGRRWPGCETIVVPGQGHAPLLVDQTTIGRIRDFIARMD